jgi:peroxiredoxin
MKQFKYLTICLAAIFFMLISGPNGEARDPQHAAQMPAFSYLDLEGNKFSNEHLAKDRKVVLMYLNPLCDVCQRETEDILNNIEYFKNIQIVMVSPSPIEQVKKFAEMYHLDQYKEIVVLHDSKDEFYRQFNAIGYPSLYLYNEKKQLITSFEREVQFAELQEAFEVYARH